MNAPLYGFLFLAAASTLWLHLWKPQRVGISVPRIVMGGCVFALCVHLILILASKSLALPTTAWERQMTLTVLLGSIGFYVSFFPARLSLSLVIFAALAVGLIGLGFYSSERPLETLPSPWLASHILFMLLGEALFFLAFCLSLVYLLADSLLRRRKVNHVLTRITSLPDLDRWTGDLIFVGFSFLSLGILLGVFFAKQFWSENWWVDAKVIFCLASWSYFAVILGVRLFKPSVMRGRRTALLNLVGFLGLLFVAWGVEQIFPSRHQDYLTFVSRERFS